MPVLTRAALVASAILMTLSTPAQADDDPSFLKLGGEPGKLQTRVADYVSQKTRVEVTLYSVLHIGEPGYYRRIQADLRGYDVVLFERIERGKTDAGTAGAKQLDAFLSSRVDRLVGTLTGLTTQVVALDHEQDNMRKADMTYEELIAAAGGAAALTRMLPTGLVAQRDALITQLTTLRDQLAKAPAKRQAAVRWGVRGQLARSTAAGAMTPEQERVLIRARNAVAIRHLERELATRKTGRACVLYGAHHGPDLHRRLAALGFAQKSTSWRTAWTTGPAPR